MSRDGERLRQAFWICLEAARAHYQGRGPGRRRGHPWVYGWDLYLALLLFRAYLRATYRETVAIYGGLFPDRPCPSFQSLHRFAKGVREEELRGLLWGLRERLLPLLPEEEALLLMDSTGLAHRSKGQRLRWRRGSQLWQVRGHSRLLCLVRYYRGRRLLVLEEVAVGPAYASDVRLGLRALGQTGAGGKLLADRAMGSRAIWALLEGKGMEAHIPLKGGGEVRDRRRLAARKRFDPSLYRLRGVVEGVFGALKTRLAGGYLQEVLPQMAQKRAYLEAAARGLAPAVAPLNALATTLAPQPCTHPLQVVICKTSPDATGLVLGQVANFV
jgi:hypothetical protein